VGDAATVENGSPAVAHVAITVPDLDEAVDWYEAALDLRPLPGRVEADVAAGERMRAAMAEIYDDRCREARVAFLVDGAGVAIELFEFNRAHDWDGPRDWEYDRAGISHVGLRVRDLPAAVDRIQACGGRRRSRIMSAGGDGSWRFCFCEDPFGTVLELQTHSQEEMYGDARA
jgi:catechol 2,3-dioxygenase-like lactoylglutathione lyase family enzyme